MTEEEILRKKEGLEKILKNLNELKVASLELEKKASNPKLQRFNVKEIVSKNGKMSDWCGEEMEEIKKLLKEQDKELKKLQKEKRKIRRNGMER